MKQNTARDVVRRSCLRLLRQDSTPTCQTEMRSWVVRQVCQGNRDAHYWFEKNRRSLVPAARSQFSDTGIPVVGSSFFNLEVRDNNLCADAIYHSVFCIGHLALTDLYLFSIEMILYYLLKKHLRHHWQQPNIFCHSKAILTALKPGIIQPSLKGWEQIEEWTSVQYLFLSWMTLEIDNQSKLFKNICSLKLSVFINFYKFTNIVLKYFLMVIIVSFCFQVIQFQVPYLPEIWVKDKCLSFGK